MQNDDQSLAKLRRAATLTAVLSVVVFVALIVFASRRLGDIESRTAKAQGALSEAEDLKSQLETEIAELEKKRDGLQQILSNVAEEDQETLRRATERTVEASPQARKSLPFVFFHIGAEEQRAPAQEVANALSRGGYVPQGIERVASSPAETELRYFHQGADVDRDIEAIERLLKAGDLPFQTKLVELSEHRLARISRRHYEVWFGNDFPPAAEPPPVPEPIEVAEQPPTPDVDEIRHAEEGAQPDTTEPPTSEDAPDPEPQPIETAGPPEREPRPWRSTQLVGHREDVIGLTFDPSSRMFATWSDDGAVIVWSARGELLHRLSKSNLGCRAASFSPDSRLLATGCNDGRVRVWDLQTGRELREPFKHRAFLAIYTVSFGCDSQSVLSTSDDGWARLWRLDDEYPSVAFGSKAFRARFATFDRDCARLAVGSKDDMARVWTLDGKKSELLKAHRGTVVMASFSLDGSRIATASRDNTAKVWQRDEGRRAWPWRRLATLTHKEDVVSAVFSRDGRKVLTGSDDGTARIWNADGSGEEIQLAHENDVNSAVFSPDQRWVLTASDDETARLWRVDGQPGQTLEHKKPVNGALFSPNGAMIVTVTEDDGVFLWRPAD